MKTYLEQLRKTNKSIDKAEKEPRHVTTSRFSHPLAKDTKEMQRGIDLNRIANSLERLVTLVEDGLHGE